MKTFKFSGLVPAFVIGAVLLSGCSKTADQDKPHYDAPPAASSPAVPAPAVNSIAYYAQNLDDAKKTWQACRAKGASALTEPEKEQCANAQSAWEMQPYKAGAKR